MTFIVQPKPIHVFYMENNSRFFSLGQIHIIGNFWGPCQIRPGDFCQFPNPYLWTPCMGLIWQIFSNVKKFLKRYDIFVHFCQRTPPYKKKLYFSWPIHPYGLIRPSAPQRVNAVDYIKIWKNLYSKKSLWKERHIFGHFWPYFLNLQINR